MVEKFFIPKTAILGQVIEVFYGEPFSDIECKLTLRCINIKESDNGLVFYFNDNK